MKPLAIALWLLMLLPLGLLLRPLWRRHIGIRLSATTYWNVKRPGTSMRSQW
jgi:hypothetical protein